MGKRRRRSKNAGRIYEKHRTILRSIDTIYPNKKEARTNKKRRRKLKMDKKKDNEDHQRTL
jgi:hypothetical protein